jgi:type I restriction enzyme S subunit
MSELAGAAKMPSCSTGWEDVELGSVSSLITSGSRGWADYYAEEGALFLRITNLRRSTVRLDLQDCKYVRIPSSDNEGRRTRVESGDVLVSITADLGIVAVVPEAGLGEAYVNQHIALVRTDRKKIDPLFGGYYLAGPGQRQFIRFNDAGAKAGMSLPSVRKLRVLLPPLPEQRKIAAILSSVDEAIEGTQAVIDQLQVVKKAMMADLLTRGLPGRHKTFKQTEIGEVPEEWDIVPLEVLAERICVGIVVKPASYYTATGVLCLRGKNVKEDRLVLDDVVFISKQSNILLGKSMLRAGDVVTVRTGEPGTSCVIPDSLDGANCIDIIITTPGSRIDSHFLSRFLNSAEGRAVVATGKGGLAQQHFNVGAMKQMPVPVPNRKEQHAIVAALSSMDGRLAQEAGAIEGLKQLKSALMSVLLTGEVRVRVDEESAA